MKANNEIKDSVNPCYGITKDSNKDDYLFVFEYAENGDLHNYLSKNFREVTWKQKIDSVSQISLG